MIPGQLRMSWCLLLVAVGAVVATATAPQAWALQGDFPSPTHGVPRDQVAAAMLLEAQQGYNLRISANSPRFTANVLLALVRTARADRPEGPPLLIAFEDWYAAYVSVTRISRDSVPDFIALQREYRQNQYVDYRPEHTAIEVKKGPEPDLVVNVLVGWPDEPDGPSEYTYIDSASTPSMQATNKRIIRYRLLDYGDMIVQAEIEGIHGRPLGGAIGAVMSVIGNGRVVESRFAVSGDGLLVTYSRAKKGFISVRQTTTTYPDGTIDKDVPDDREDLLEIADRLKQDIEIKYLKSD